MQLSLPIPAQPFPDPAASGSFGPDNTLAALCGQPATDPGATSFEELLPKDEKTPDPTGENRGADVGTAESILAAACWIPGLVPPPTTLPAPLATGAGEEAASGPAPTPGMADGNSGGRSVLPALARRGIALAEAVAGEKMDAQSQDTTGDFALPGQPTVPAAKAAACFVPPSVRVVAPLSAEPAAPDFSASTHGEVDGNGATQGTPGATVSPSPLASAASDIAAALARPEQAAIMQAGADASERARTPFRRIPSGVTAAAAVASPVVRLAPQVAITRSVAVEPQPSPRAHLPEEFAVSPATDLALAADSDAQGKKDFLKTEHASVTSGDARVGIRVAELTAAMSTANPNRFKSAPAVEPVPVMPMVMEKHPLPDLAVNVPDFGASVREAMATVLSAVEALERREGTGAKSVDYQFQVGSEHLALRVELRDGAVHATFRTNSSELRSALAQEWEAVVPPAAGRELRLAEPVFSSSLAHGAEAASSSLGQGTPHRRHENRPETPTGGPVREFTSVAPVAEPAAAPTARAHALLHAFA